VNPSGTLWSDAAHTRRFIIPDGAELPPGEFAIRTAGGRAASVDEAAVLPYEVSEDEARVWAKEQLGGVLGELRGRTVSFVEDLRRRTAEMREENRAAWEKGLAGASPEVRDAAARLGDRLRDLGEALRRAAREHGSAAPPPATDDASAEDAKTPP
jgi:hypothetical protein